MGLLATLLKNAPKIKAWVAVASEVLDHLQNVLDKINADKNLPNIK